MLSRSRHRVSRKSAFKDDSIADSETRRSEKCIRQVYPECRGSGGVGRGIERGYRESSRVEGRWVDIEFLHPRTRVKGHSRPWKHDWRTASRVLSETVLRLKEQ